MGCLYTRKKSLWLAYTDASGERMFRASGYKVGQEIEAQALLEELERRVAETAIPPVITGAKASAAVEKTVTPIVAAGVTVQEYGERWIESRRKRVGSVGDEHGRLKNHVYSRIGPMLMRDVRPRHIRDMFLDLATAKVRRRGTGKGEGTSKIAPRTVRHVFATLHRMFKSAVIDEEIESNPVVVEKGVLPKNVDKDPAWRATAVFERTELVTLISDQRVPEVRRVLNALKGLAALRHGEAAGLLWGDYHGGLKPLGKLVVSRSYENERTKTQISREVPVHPVLAAVLAHWFEHGWKAAFGRAPAADDLVVPKANGTVWEAHDADDYFKDDLTTLGLRHRRGHDLRRTFITLAQVDGARRDILKVMTHGAAAADIVSLYTTFPWPTLCAEVQKLEVSLPTPGAASEVIATKASPVRTAPIEVIEAEIETRSQTECHYASCDTTCDTDLNFPSTFEPLARFERATYGLRNRCSTTEL